MCAGEGGVAAAGRGAGRDAGAGGAPAGAGGELLVARRDAARGVDRRREQLQAQIDRVLRLSGAVAAASRRLQVIDTNAACIEN